MFGTRRQKSRCKLVSCCCGADVQKTQKDVEALNKKLTIQLDNLCQFLPQEKVVEFSKMTPQELLMSTESAIGDGGLRDMHVKLQEGGAQLAALQNEQYASLRACCVCCDGRPGRCRVSFTGT